MKILFNFSGALLIAALLSGCVPFKDVGTFTATSQKSLQGINLSYGSYKYCRDSCYIYNKKISSLNDLDCNCSRDSLRDTIILNEFSILESYYGALTKLSGVSLIDLSPVGKSIKKGTYGSITISDDEATTFTNLSQAISSLVTLKYKSQKLKEFIGANNPLVQKCLEKLGTQLDVLNVRIKNMERTYKITIRDLLDTAPAQSERFMLINIYRQKEDELEEAKSQYIVLKNILSKINAGEVLLNQNIDNLKDAKFGRAILLISGNIIYLNSKSN